MSSKRKPRSDRNHIIYCITAPDGQQYVGLTVVVGTPLKSLQRRWLKHVNRAKNEQHAWQLCDSIRQHQAEGFQLEILEKVRGKAAAHEREVELISARQPSLNTARTGKT